MCVCVCVCVCASHTRKNNTKIPPFSQIIHPLFSHSTHHAHHVVFECWFWVGVCKSWQILTCFVSGTIAEHKTKLQSQFSQNVYFSFTYLFKNQDKILFINILTPYFVYTNVKMVAESNGITRSCVSHLVW